MVEKGFLLKIGDKQGTFYVRKLRGGLGLSQGIPSIPNLLPSAVRRRSGLPRPPIAAKRATTTRRSIGRYRCRCPNHLVLDLGVAMD